MNALKFIHPKKEQAEEHYKDHVGTAYFPGLVHCMTSGPSVLFVLSGQNAVAGVRALVGPTDPQSAAAGTIRGDLSIQAARNLVNASDSVANAQREIALWFKPEELVSWVSCQTPWLYE